MPRPQRYTHSDFVRALGDRVRRDCEDSGSREQKGAGREDQHHSRGQVDTAKTIENHLVQTPEVIGWLSRIQAEYLLADEAGEVQRITGGSHYESGNSFRLLRERHVCRRSGIVIHGVWFHVANNSYNRAERVALFRPAHPNTLTQWIFAGPAPPRHRIADDCYGRSIGGVLIGEQTSLLQGNAQDGEKLRSDDL